MGSSRQCIICFGNALNAIPEVMMKIWINGALRPENEARISVFDSGFVLGDGVWEGIRVVGGRPAFLDAHLARLEEGARTLMIHNLPERGQLAEAVDETITGNALVDDAHLRLMLTRGRRREP